jgi:hypothetical protein
MKDESETSDEEEMNMDQVLSAVFNDSNIGKA